MRLFVFSLFSVSAMLADIFIPSFSYPLPFVCGIAAGLAVHWVVTEIDEQLSKEEQS